MKNATIAVFAIIGIIAAFFAGQFFAGSNKPSVMAQVFPSPTAISRAAVVTQVQRLSRLETSHYSIEKIIPEDKRVEVFGGSFKTETLLLVAYGEILAGIDLSKITEKDLQVSDQEVIVYLPPAQIFNADSAVNDAKTYVYQRGGLPFFSDKDLETRARARASTELVLAACEAGILKSATDNAVIAVTQLLASLAPTVKVIPSSLPPQCPFQPTGTPTP